jgi:hypothetical protein
MRRPSIAFARAHHCAAALLAECRLILPKAQAPQPDHNVHEGALTKGRRPSWSCPGGVSSWRITYPDTQVVGLADRPTWRCCGGVGQGGRRLGSVLAAIMPLA